MMISDFPLLFLHGFLGTSADWEPVRSYLSDFQTMALDLPGHGIAPFTEKFDIDCCAERFILVGYSMGGRLAMRFAAENPERIKSLILISSHPGLNSDEEKKQRLISDAEWAKLLLELPIDEFLRRWYDQPLFHPFKPNLSERRMQNKEALAAALLQFSLAKQPRYDTDGALILVGERDRKFRSLYKDPTVIPNAGHMVHLENPKAVAEEIKKRMLSL